MSLQAKSQELKEIISTYDTQWFLGDLSGLMQNIASGRAQDQLGSLSSPQRQLYFLGGLLVTSSPTNGLDNMYSPEKWNKIIELLNDIEKEYDKTFFPKENEEIDEKWKHIRNVALPSFLSYFNQGPLNYEEQTINWTSDLYSQLDEIILKETKLKTIDFIQFYDNLDSYVQKNFGSFSPKAEVRPDWKNYTKIEMVNTAPPELGYFPDEQQWAMYHFIADQGMISRFLPSELVSDNLSIDSVNTIINLLKCSRVESDFIYYTSTKPGNPLYEKPIIDIGNGMFQVFEVKQVMHAIENLLETICSKTVPNSTKLIDRKGKLLENRIVELLSKFFKKDYKVYQSYYVDGNEQDILFLWKNYAFIIEAKGYNLREPFRDPNKAFIRIKDDFKNCIGYGYTQTKRVEEKFKKQIPLKIEDKNGNLIEEIDTTKYEEQDFSIIVNLNSFGQIQNDLSTLLDIEADEDVYPWVIKLDDLEVFLLTLISKKKPPLFLVNYLLLREKLHGKLICSDELEICGAYLLDKLNEKSIESAEKIIMTPDLPEIFDEQYRKVMGFKNEKNLYEKKSGKFMFW